MRARWFIRDEGINNYRLKGHAEEDFYGWVGTWASVLRMPSDIGFKNDGFILPPLNFIEDKIITSKRDNGKLRYRNTDGVGFVKSLREDLKFDTSDKNILIFGCGGAGRAVIAGLTCEGANVQKIYIYDTNKEAVESAKKHFSQFQDVINKLKFISSEQIPNSINECRLLVNASPVGMKEGDGSVVDKNLLHKDLYVYDVVCNRETQLIKDAKSLGLRFLDGLGMLLHQGAAAFEFWAGQEAPVEIMRKALEEELAILKRIGLPESYRGRA